MAELQPPDAALVTAASLPIPTAISPTPTTLTTTSNPTCTAPPPPPPPSDIPPTNKRQRRPSVRLGEIGDSPSETHFRRGPKTWRYHKDPSLAAKTSKTRPLTNLDNNNYEEDDNNLDLVNRKSKKPAKRVRTSWHSTSAAKFETSTPPNGGHDEDNYFRQDSNDDFREFDGSESPLKEHSPINSMYWDRTGIRSRVSDHHNNGLDCSGMDKTNIGVRDWLIGLGLGRYAPLFDIHEVDDEVLPMLTLEDLKDMGINAVGSRRKMYNALLKLRKGFS